MQEIYIFSQKSCIFTANDGRNYSSIINIGSHAGSWIGV